MRTLNKVIQTLFANIKTKSTEIQQLKMRNKIVSSVLQSQLAAIKTSEKQQTSATKKSKKQPSIDTPQNFSLGVNPFPKSPSESKDQTADTALAKSKRTNAQLALLLEKMINQNEKLALQLKDKHYQDNFSEYQDNMDKVEHDKRKGKADKRTVRERSQERLLMLGALKDQLEHSVVLQTQQRVELIALRKEFGVKRKQNEQLNAQVHKMQLEIERSGAGLVLKDKERL